MNATTVLKGHSENDFKLTLTDMTEKSEG